MSDHATLLAPSDTFVHRHIGPRPHETAAMLAALGVDSLDALIDRTVPVTICVEQPLRLLKLSSPLYRGFPLQD